MLPVLVAKAVQIVTQLIEVDSMLVRVQVAVGRLLFLNILIVLGFVVLVFEELQSVL